MSITDELRKYIEECDMFVHPNRLLRIADRIDAELAERYMALPVDADGVPIHVGDRLDGYGKTIEVVEIRHGRSGWVVISRDGNGYADTFAFTHYKPPTVEDVLRAMCIEIDRRCESGSIDYDKLFAEYAAKLRLAGEDE